WGMVNGEVQRAEPAGGVANHDRLPVAQQFLQGTIHDIEEPGLVDIARLEVPRNGGWMMCRQTQRIPRPALPEPGRNTVTPEIHRGKHTMDKHNRGIV